MRKGICDGCFGPGVPMERRFHVAKEAGFEGIELTVTLPGGDLPTGCSDDVIRQIADLAAETVPVCSVRSGPTLWQHPLCHPDPAEREIGKQAVITALRTAAACRTNAILVVPGIVTDEISYEHTYEQSKKTLLELATVADDLGISIGVENVWNKFLLSPLEMRQFVDEIDHPHVGVYFDVGNVLLFGYPEQWIDVLGKRILKVHVKDFKTSVGTIEGFVDLLEGDVNWPAVVAALRRIGYADYITPEINPCEEDPLRAVYNASEALDKILGF